MGFFSGITAKGTATGAAKGGMVAAFLAFIWFTWPFWLLLFLIYWFVIREKYQHNKKEKYRY